MNSINIALLAALYNGNSNLYKEIYFPIIKFALTLCLKESEDKCTSSIDKLHSKINQEFGVLIPRVVIKKAINHLIKKNNAFKVNLMENDTLKVHKADINLLDDIYHKEKLVESSLQRLEQSYIEYFRNLDIVPEKSFTQFFSAQIQEIVNYLNNRESEATINEGYTHNVKYLLWLEKHDIELYESANKILWGATVAGFLGREDYEFDVKPISGCRYYLDTAIIMGCLDLSYEKIKKYSQELVQVIKSSSSVACVHPITLDEITGIIKAVETEGKPRVETSIYEAFERRNLTCSQLTNIRLNLRKQLQNLGIEILPEEENVVKIKNDYAGKIIVKKLETQRSGIRTGENPRDIHDAYMIDFVLKERGQSTIREKIKAYFVTMNDDLRHFSAEYYGNPINALIAPSSVIFDLWLHGVNLKSQVRQLSLTETMSRCLALNEQSATAKIRQIFNYLDSEEMNDPKVRQEIVNGIMERSNKYLLSDNEDSPSYNISPAIASQLYKQAEIDITQKEKNIAEIQNLRNENIRVSAEKGDLEAELSRLKEKEKRRKNLEEESIKLRDSLTRLESQKKRANMYLCIKIILEVMINICVLCLFALPHNTIASIIPIIYKPELQQTLENAHNLGTRLLIGFVLIFSFYLVHYKQSSYILNIEKHKENWNNKHPEYNNIRNKLGEVEQKLGEF